MFFFPRFGSPGPLVPWSSGPLVLWSSGSWCFGPVVLVPWSSGPLASRLQWLLGFSASVASRLQWLRGSWLLGFGGFLASRLQWLLASRLRWLFGFSGLKPISFPGWLHESKPEFNVSFLLKTLTKITKEHINIRNLFINTFFFLICIAPHSKARPSSAEQETTCSRKTQHSSARSDMFSSY